MSDSYSVLAYQLALLHAPQLGPKRFATIIQHYPDLAELFQQPQAITTIIRDEALLDYLKKPDWPSVERTLSWSQQPNHHILLQSDSLYPKLLREIAAAPPLLFVKGNPAILAKPQLAIVGSRNPSPTGSDNAYEFAQQLALAGLVISSGLALGIDAASHRGTLAANGLTIAVLGTGINRIYPAKHSQLAEQIVAKQGALISELPLDAPPLAQHFPRRNRLISGLSLGVLVVEANINSGSLITVRYALEQNREIFAIPGSIHNPLAKGCHALIREGAKLVENVNDILSELPELNITTQQPTMINHSDHSVLLTAESLQLLNCLADEITPIDLLIARTGFSAATVASLLSVLEIKGYVQAVNGGYVKTKMAY